jgi:hypothetical protein
VRRKFSRTTALSLFVGVILVLSLFYVNLRFTRSNPGGNDFLPRWVGTRVYLTTGQSPYSAEATAAIQDAIYGRAAQPDEDQALFAYPFYSIFLFAPFAFIPDYAVARAAWVTLQEIAIVLTAVAAISLNGWKPGRVLLATFLLFALTWYHGARPLVDGNAAILVTAFFTGGLLAMRKNKDVLAGALFALSTIKPQMVLIPLIFVLLWSLWQGRQAVIVSTLAILVGLVGLSFLLQPGWLLANLQQVLVYQSYLPPMTSAGIWGSWWGDTGRLFGWVINLVVVLVLAVEWWQARGKSFERFLWVVCLTIAASPFTGLISTSSNYAIMLLVLVCIFGFWQKRVGEGAGRLAWAHLALLFFGLWILFLLTLEPGPQFRENLIMFFPAPIFLLLNLYWLRWGIARLEPTGLKAVS